MSGIDESRLTPQQRTKLAELRRGALGAQSGDPTTMLTFVIGLSFVLAGGLAILGIVYVDWFTNVHAIVVFVVVAGGICTAALRYQFRWLARVKREAIAHFTDRIRAQQTEQLLEQLERGNFRADDAGGTSGPHYSITGHYDPQRYHSYTSSERDIMRVHGIDGDTFDSNVAQ